MKAILLTGGSAGIGLATSKMLMDCGYRVYSGSRHEGNAQKSTVSDGEIIPLKIDVNDESQLTAAVSQIIAENNELYAVVCNAGNGIAGAIEDTTIEEARYQLETNFFGAVRTIKACLPQFRTQKKGKIVVVTSMAAIIPIPFQGFYSAGKAALQILVESLAMEVKPFDIQCCTILPGDTKTNFTASRKYTEASQKKNSAYFKRMKTAVGKMEKDEQNGMKPEAIAKAIVKQVNKNKMKKRVVPGFQYKALAVLNGLLPNSLRLKVIDMVYS